MGFVSKMFLFWTLTGILVWNVSANQTTSTTSDPNLEEQLLPAFELPINLTLKLCRCKGLPDSDCLNQGIYVTLLELEFYQQQNVLSTDFSDVKVEDINCPTGLAMGRLLNYIDYTFILTTGELFWVNADSITLDYCVEAIPDGWGAQVCMEPPRVPRCCPPGELLGPGDSCIKSKSQASFSPPVMHNNELLENVLIEHVEVRNITCKGIEVQRIVSLDGEGALQYDPYQALLTYKPPSYSPYVEPEENYCVGINGSGGPETKYVAKFCHVDPKEEHHHICRNSTCVRKCCNARQFLLNGDCADLSENETVWEPLFHERQSLKPGAGAPTDLITVFGLPFCDSFYKLQPELVDSDKSHLLKDGSLYTDQISLAPHSYCLETEMTEDGDWKRIAIVCPPEENCSWKSVLDVVLLSLSCVFLIATMAVYIGVSDLRDRTNGRCLLSMVTAMLATYVSLIVNNRAKDPSDLECLLTAFFGHVFGLAMFFWLNVMCYDMWATLRSSQQQHQSKKTFIKYSIYAWGIPLFIGITTMIIDRVQPDNVILPGFLEFKRCWFVDDTEYWLYLSGIILVLILANLFFFVHVAITLARKLQQRQSVFDNSNSRTSQNTSSKTKQQAWLYVKLFIVMGVVWIADISSSIRHRHTCSFWVVTDIINALQGVFIFLVAVCNRDNLRKFRHAWNPRVMSMRSKMSTVRGMSTVASKSRRKTAESLATSEASRKTSVTSLPRKISTVSGPPNKEARTSEISALSVEGSRISGTNPPSRKISLASNLETIPMNPIEE